MMSIFESLMNNKGTVSSALGKTYAQEVLDGKAEVLDEAIRLSAFDVPDEAMKQLRSGAAKIVEIVAEERPELVAPHLGTLFPALEAREPQTRWMIIRVFGFCAGLNRAWASKAIPFAERYIAEREGLCICSSADLFLGDYGAISPADAKKVYPILARSARTLVPNEEDWLLEAFMKIYTNLGPGEKTEIARFAKRWEKSGKKSTQARAKKLLRME